MNTNVLHGSMRVLHALPRKLGRRRGWSGRRARVGRRSNISGRGGSRGRHWPTVARAKPAAVRKAGLTTFAGCSPHADPRFAGGAGAGRTCLRRCGCRRRTVQRDERLASVIRTLEVQPTRVVRLLERRRVAQARLARAVDDAVTLVLAQVLCAPDALVHRQLTRDLDAAVVQLFLLKLRRTTRREQPEATEGQRTHGCVYARPSAPLHPQNVTVAPPLIRFSFSLSPLYHL